jgi:hypothetical protein
VSSRIVLALLCLAGVPASSAAQPAAQRHQGFWIGFGFGGGVNLSKGLDHERLTSGSFYVRLGGTPNQRLLLGFEAIGWAKERNDVILSRGNATFTAMWYPCRCGGVFLKGGIGSAAVNRDVQVGDEHHSATKGGFGTTFGVGGDLKIGRNLYLTPNLDWLVQIFDSETAKSNHLFLFTLGLTWH